MGGGPKGFCRPQAWRDRNGARHHRPRSRPLGPLQGSKVSRVWQPAEDIDRQDSEIHASRSGLGWPEGAHQLGQLDYHSRAELASVRLSHHMEPKSQPTSPQRWAADDERGALNLIDQASVRRALGAARLCRVVALGIPLNSRTPVLPPRPPVLHAMLVDGADYSAGARRAPNGFQFADDYLAMAIHSGTNLDALSHVARTGIMYNGIPATEVRSRSGATRLGVEKVGGIVCRGILLDVASTKPWEPSRVITTSDLQQAMLVRSISAFLLVSVSKPRGGSPTTAWY